MGICLRDRLRLATIGCKDVGESGFEDLSLAPQRICQSQLRGPKGVIINY